MESLLATVRELLVRAVPTFLIFTFLYLYLRSTLFGPLQKVLDEREAATSGTKKAADEALKKAERKAAEYEEKLRAARAEIYKEQEEMRNRLRASQLGHLAAAKERIDWKIREAAAAIQADKTASAERLDADSGALADEIVTAILSGSNA
jgi:F-type H+-transporting ATPase subunit b